MKTPVMVLLCLAIATACTATHPRLDAVAEPDVEVESRADDAGAPMMGAAAAAARPTQCKPGAPLENESTEIQALPDSIRQKYLLADCPTSGCATPDTPKATSNELKSRASPPGSDDFDADVSLQAVMASSDDDRTRFDEKRAAHIVGFVRDVKIGGTESVNCRTSNSKFKDTHIELSIEPTADLSSPEMMVVEVTPRTRAIAAGQDMQWATPDLKTALKGHWVAFDGWLFFDDDHCNESLNTLNVSGSSCGGMHNTAWRRTAWEIHPVTAFQVLPGNPNQ